MTSTINQQTARRKADQRLRTEFQERYLELMQEEHKRMGLTYAPRLSPEERAAAKAEAEKDKTVEKIKAMAKKVGVGVLLVEDPEIEAKLQAAADGTSEGVAYDWQETNEERANRISAEAEAAEEDAAEVDYRH